MPRWQPYAIVALAAAIVFLTNLGGPRLWDRDEPRNAGCAAEMMARGDWIVPVFNGELRTHKPVLLYWLMMVSYSVLGVSEFSARLPSALLAIGTALCTVELGRRLFSPRTGLWAGMVVATSLMFVVAGRAATPDSSLIFFSALAVTLFGCGIPVTDPRVTVPSHDASTPWTLSWPRAAGMYAAMGMATLAKGPIGIVIPSAIIGLYYLLATHHGASATRNWQKRVGAVLAPFHPRRILRATWCLRPLTGLAVLLLVAAPWYVLVGWRTDGEFLRGFFVEHNLNRAMSTMEGHRGNVLFYPITLLVGLFPWSVLVLPLALDLYRQLRPRPASSVVQAAARLPPGETLVVQTTRARLSPGYLLAGCWLAVYLVVFSLAKTKLPSYITPSYPAAALVFGAFIDRWLTGTLLVDRRWLQAAALILAGTGIVVTAGLAVALHQQLPGTAWLGALGLVPVAAGAGWWLALRGEHRRFASLFLSGGAVAFATLLFAVGASRVDRFQLNHRLLEAIDARAATPRVVAYGCLEPSWVFYGGRSIDEITAGSIQPTHAPFVEVAGKWVAKQPVTFHAVAEHDESFVITTERLLDAARKQLPADFQVLETVPLFLKNERLVLLGRPDSVQMARRERPERASGR